MKDGKIPVIAVLGPTASGKTALAAELAARLNGEVISCDSMQVYRGLSVATAKPTAEEMRGVPHHLIDFLEPTQSFSVADYVLRARAAAEQISARGGQVILCGGTGLYADAFLDGVSFGEMRGAAEKRDEIRRYYETHGVDALAARLFAADPDARAQIDMKNPKRVMRALEIVECTGEPLAAYRAGNRESASPYRSLRLVIDFQDRERLYERIHLRVDRMLADGLVEEAARYYQIPGVTTASQAIGYKELKPFLDGTQTLSQAVDALKQATRRYAKRQQTWFRRNPQSVFLYADTEDIRARALTLCETFLKGNLQNEG